MDSGNEDEARAELALFTGDPQTYVTKAQAVVRAAASKAVMTRRRCRSGSPPRSKAGRRLVRTQDVPAWLLMFMNDSKPSAPPLVALTGRAHTQGTEFLVLGLSVGALGVAGAALGAVCPLCVVATPALLGLGVAQKVRGYFHSRRSSNPAALPSLEFPAIEKEAR